MSISNTAHSLGPAFWHSIELKKKSPIFHIFPSHEIEHPFRKSKSLIVRVPFSKWGIVLGWWRKTGHDEDTAILSAMTGRPIGLDEFTDVRTEG